MPCDYRQFEAQAESLEKRVQALNAKQNRTPDERDECLSLMGQIHALEGAAGRVKEAELADLRASIANGTAVTGPGSYAFDGGAVQDFHAYLKSGGEIRNSMSSGSDPGGGYLVPEPEHAALLEVRRAIDPILRLATNFQMTGSDTMYLPRKATIGEALSAVESAARPETDAPTFTSGTLVARDYYASQKVTQLLLDSVAGIESMLTSWLYADAYGAFSHDLAVGTGSGEPLGLFGGGGFFAHYPSGSGTALVNTCFIGVACALHPDFLPNAAWLMNGTTLATISMFSHPGNDTQLLVDWSSGSPRLLGYPIYRCDAAPQIGAGTFPIAFGDISQAMVTGVHRAPSVIRNPYSEPPFVLFQQLARLAGTPWNAEACILVEVAAS